MSREYLLFLEDIVIRGEAIARYCSGIDLNEYLADQRTRDAVERNFQVIGDAVKSLPRDITDREPGVPWSLLARFRDVLTHAYFRVDAVEVWQTATLDLRPILEAVRRMVAESSD